MSKTGRYLRMRRDSIDALLALVRAGLWEQEVRLAPSQRIDFKEVYRLSEEQAVVGIVSSGLEHLDVRGVSGGVYCELTEEESFLFVVATLQLEERNIAMNGFIVSLLDKMHTVGVFPILVKGQGIAQCYSRPLRRSCGDVDFLLNETNYNEAIQVLAPLASLVEKEIEFSKHLALTIDEWVVELHGSLHGGLWKRMDSILDSVQAAILQKGRVRTWQNGDTNVLLPAADEDVVYVFAHILEHFFHEGVGLRQICDWTRLLWCCKESLDTDLLELRLRRMGALSEWKAFGAFAVNYLGMPQTAMPLYSSNAKWRKKAQRILSFMIETGSFGHNRDFSYHSKATFIKRKWISFRRHTKDAAKYFVIFPADAIKLWWRMLTGGICGGVRQLWNKQ